MSEVRQRQTTQEEIKNSSNQNPNPKPEKVRPIPPPKPGETSRSKIITRTLVGLPMVFGALLTISSNYAPYIFSAVVFLVQTISFREVKEKKNVKNTYYLMKKKNKGYKCSIFSS